jgi:HD domain-containing protein
MSPQRFLPRLANAGFWLFPISLVFGAYLRGWRPARTQLLLLAFVLVALGELLEVDLRGGRSTPVSNAVAFALFVAVPSSLGVVVAVLPAYFVAMAVRARELGWGPRFRSTTRRLGTLLASLAFFHFLSLLIPALPVHGGRALTRTIAMVMAGGFYLVVETGASALFIARAQRIPLAPIWRGQISNRLSLHAALLSVAALMALAEGVLGDVAFVLFLLPLLAARYSFKRYASIHKTYVQTIRALSKVPELAGYAREGHSHEVAELAMNIARDRGLSDNEVEEVEFAALLHDVGKITFDDPDLLPESVTGTSSGVEILEASAQIVAKTPYLDRVAKVIRNQRRFAERSSEDGDAVLMLESRILKVANAYVELTEEGGPALSPGAALRCLDGDTGTVYDAEVVNSLRRVLERRVAVAL